MHIDVGEEMIYTEEHVDQLAKMLKDINYRR